MRVPPASYLGHFLPNRAPSSATAESIRFAERNTRLSPCLHFALTSLSLTFADSLLIGVNPHDPREPLFLRFG